ncbi:MAG: ATP-binding cassette domain-containing protein [Anaerolineae bacterium]|nr:ATP-binding cassette domain-containing protein [Phycisphaerae bacterium]
MPLAWVFDFHNVTTTSSSTSTEIAVRVDRVTHRYGSRVALSDVSLDVRASEIFGFLGPNGSGKTTLFRLLSTLIPPAEGRVTIFNRDVVSQRDDVRRGIGVVFQSPSLDKHLTASENLRHHGHLYGLRGAELESRITEMLAALNLSDRASERVGKFSGGMRRRVELAKGMLTRPGVLLLDEPSTGLDPAARIDLWDILHRARLQQGVTILLTTHLMDEADRCDRLAILESGRLLACDTPAAMKSQIGGDVISLITSDTGAASQTLRDRLGVDAKVVDGVLRVELPRAHEFVPRIIEALPPGAVQSISVGQPTLEDVFVRLTGHRFRERSVE